MSVPFYAERDWDAVAKMKSKRREAMAAQRTIQQKYDLYDNWFTTMTLWRRERLDLDAMRKQRAEMKVRERTTMLAELKSR